MIALPAIRAFLDRKLADSSKAKRFSDRALDRKLKALDPRAKFTTSPRKHQKVCFLLGVKRPAYLFFPGQGLGKSKVVLDLISYRIRCGQVKRALILVPYSANVQQWLDEVARHAPHLKAVGMDGDRADRQEALFDSGAQVVVVTYMGWLSMVCDRGGGKKGQGFKMVPKKVDKVSSLFQLVAYDESTVMLSSHTSMSFRVCRRFLKTTPYRYALTGTPFGKDPQALWSQFYLVDGGETLGPTLGLYRAVFYDEEENFWGGVKYNFRKRMKGALRRMLRHRSIRYSDAECVDLPKLVEIVRPVVFPHENWTYYERLREALVEAAKEKNKQVIENRFLRMRQVCAGFLGAKGPGGEKIKVAFSHNPKRDALIELLEEIGSEEKVVIFTDFIHSGEVVSDALTKAKVRHVRLYSGTSNKAKAVASFQKDPKVRVLVMSQSGAFGLNLQHAARYMVVYDPPVSPIVRSQLIKRIHRIGQNRRVFVYYLPVRKSVDEQILKSTSEGIDLLEAVVGGDAKRIQDIAGPNKITKEHSNADKVVERGSGARHRVRVKPRGC